MPIKMDKMIPPDIHEILSSFLNEGHQWYEVRSLAMGLYSYPLQEYDTALGVAKALNLPSSVQLYHCWVEEGEIRDEKIY